MRIAAMMTLPALALLLLAAHFFRAGLLPLAALSFGMIALLFVRRPWAATALQVALCLGTVEWLRTAWLIAARRVAEGQPYARMLVILGSVAAFTLLAALAFRREGMRHAFDASAPRPVPRRR
jgi:hypothetical protein